jgi:RNA polymerase sigma-70 factor (ECF subfamily)
VAEPGSSRDDDAALVAACLARQDAAWERLLLRYTPVAVAAIRAALKRCGHARDAALEDELAADVFALLAKNDARVLRSYRGEAGLATFLSVIAARHVFRAMRDRGRYAKALTGRAEAEPERTRLEAAPELERAGNEERAATIRSAILELEGTDRLLLTHYYLDGRTYKEIAEVMGFAVGGTGTKIARARERLRNLLAEKGLDPGQGVPGDED